MFIDTDPNDNIIDDSVLVSFHSLASFLMWLKLLYFMRIYKETGKKTVPTSSDNVHLLFRLSCEDHL
jgi:hypothetical protein